MSIKITANQDVSHINMAVGESLDIIMQDPKPNGMPVVVSMHYPMQHTIAVILGVGTSTKGEVLVKVGDNLVFQNSQPTTPPSSTLSKCQEVLDLLSHPGWGTWPYMEGEQVYHDRERMKKLMAEAIAELGGGE